MWRVMKTIISTTLFAAVAVVIEDAKRRPGVTFWNSFFLFLALVISLAWMCHEIGEVWHAWECGKDEEPPC